MTILLFFFNDTATTEIYTLSLHDALPISLEHALPWAERLTGFHTAEGDYLPNRLRILRSEEHTSELQSQSNLVCRLLLEKKKNSEANEQLILSPISLTSVVLMLREYDATL